MILEKLGRHQWSKEEEEKYLGHFEALYSSYALDEKLRRNATSGGSVTAILWFMLQHQLIDGAMVLKSSVVDGEVNCYFEIAKDLETLISAQGSKYTAVKFGSEQLNTISNFNGRLAVVLLPCDCTKLQRFLERNENARKKIKLVIGLVCGHNSEPTLTREVVCSLEKPREELVDFKYRIGHWRGTMQAKYKDGSIIEKSGNYLLDYQNLYFFSEQKCHSCHDHFAYNCDLAAGDIWNYSRQKTAIHPTGLICRTKSGHDIVKQAFENGFLNIESETVKEILDGQSRTLPFHYNTTARSKVGRIFGLKIKDTVNEKVPWNIYITTFIALLNERISKTNIGRKLIFLTPRPIIRLYLYFFKALELIK